MNWFVTIGGIAYNFIIIAICTAFILINRKKAANASEDFVFGGKKMGWFACAASIALTALGGGHINGLSVQSWFDGVGVIWYCFGAGLCMVVVMRFSGIWYRRSGCRSINELFGKLFHPILVPILSGFCVGYCWLILCVETQGIAGVIEAMTGLPNLWSGIIGIIIGICYVCIAGIEEIGLVNSVNAILMYIFGFIALAVLGSRIPGGYDAVNGSILSSNPELLHAFGNADIIRTYIIGSFLSVGLGMNFIQSNCQAVASVPDLKIMRKAGIGAIVLNVLFGAIIISFGLISKGLANQGLIQAELGHFGMMETIMLYLPNWLQICVIGMFCAAMLSTISMVALAIALMLNHDILGYFPKFRNLTPKQETSYSRLWIVLASISAAFVAVTLQAQVNTAITWGFSWFIPLFFLFIYGLYWKRSNLAAFVTIGVCWVCNLLLSFTNMAAVFNLEGNNHAIFQVVLSVVFGFIFTAIDKKAKPSFGKMYKEQRSAYDAAKAADKAAEA